MLPGLKTYKNFIKFLFYYFSIGLLLKTFFSPWRRDITKYPQGIDFAKIFKAFAFNIISRILAAIMRICVIIFGLIIILIFTALLPIFILCPVEIKYSRLVKAGSIGKQWSYAYTPFLDKHSRELHRGKEIKLFGRQDEIEQIERILARSKQDNVLLVGEPGVGRKSVIKGLAQKISWGLSLRKLNNRRVLKLNIAGLKKDQLEQALDQSAKAGNIILVIDNFDKYLEFQNIIMPYLQADELQIIAITDYDGLHYHLKPLPGLLNLFEKVEVSELDDKQILKILEQEVKQNKIKITKKELLEIIKKSNQYIQHTPQPEKSLDVLEELSVLKKQIKTSDVDQLISQKTEVPIGEIAKHEKEKLLNLEIILHKRIINQEKAIQVISQSMRRARAGISSNKKPIGTFLFIGPTGVGKTETCKALAFAYFGREERMIRFDMSEFQEISAINRLINLLIKNIEQDPFSLLLLDEFEKANKNILNVFFQILDEGRLTSESGRIISFRNAIIIATSNAQKSDFSKPLLNRFDAIVDFEELSQEHIRKIAELMLNNLNKRLQSEKKISFKITQALINKLVELGYNPEFGARPMRRVIQDKIENQIADKVLRGEVRENNVVTLEI